MVGLLVGSWEQPKTNGNTAARITVRATAMKICSNDLPFKHTPPFYMMIGFPAGRAMWLQTLCPTAHKKPQPKANNRRAKSLGRIDRVRKTFLLMDELWGQSNRLLCLSLRRVSNWPDS